MTPVDEEDGEGYLEINFTWNPNNIFITIVLITVGILIVDIANAMKMVF